MLKKVLKIALLLLSTLMILIVILFFIYDKPLPEPLKDSGPEADAMAQKIQTALHYNSFKKSQFIEWSFQNGNNTYFWDKQKHIVNVKWDNFLVNLDLKNTGQSEVFKNNLVIKGSEKEKIINKAIKYFNNDSFWLVAPFKLFDKGTKRNIVQLEDGSKGLLVTYTTGGDTPGDSYLWKLNQSGFPESYQMWVSIIPFGGLKATWEGWQKMDSGTYLPTGHKIGPFTLSLGEVKAYN
ncbi:hypothetical protein [Sediminicola arcticus]|jgi:hypothetical protein|uniref:Uncharacterized protein n=1 Tax=Sediminicola arcticus TaxID=1574308 RepID=A0ABV2SU48_9FLAO